MGRRGKEEPEAAICQSCGRRMEPRRGDRGVTEGSERKYCSAACRKRRVTPVDRRLEAEITTLLRARPRGATICPSEAARALAEDEAEWRPLMEPVRRAARRLSARGEVEITQGGHVVDPSTAKGPIRIRRKSR